MKTEFKKSLCETEGGMFGEFFVVYELKAAKGYKGEIFLFFFTFLSFDTLLLYSFLGMMCADPAVVGEG